MVGDAKAIKGIEKATLQTSSGNVVFEEKPKPRRLQVHFSRYIM
ncbi:hypothetical protein HMPREF1212_01770 [Parabacteroides sp. HGS0025]|nr:hypothetical protein HMPREF1212_01770 [Parabacteroides sp. HGS0025]